MHIAAKRNNPELIKLLLKYKADVNAKDMNGRTPLFVAANMNNVNAVSILLSNLSNAFALDKDKTKIEETTTDPEILNMLNKGKMVT